MITSRTNQKIEETFEMKPTKSITMKKQFIEQIRSKSKTVEARTGIAMIKNINKGDIIRFFYMTNANDDVKCEVIEKTRYDSFKDMLEVFF